MKKIEITKDNYKDYTYLWQLNEFAFMENELAPFLFRTIGISFVNILIFFGICIYSNSLLLVLISLLNYLFSGFIISLAVNFQQRKRKIKKFGEDHPNIDLDISSLDLKCALKKAGILKCDNGIYYIFNITDYEKRLETEKQKLSEKEESISKDENIKEETFNNNYFIDSPTFTMEDQEKSKVKVKQYLKK